MTAKVAIEIAPDGVNVIGAVLGVVEFYQKQYTPDTAVVAPARFGSTCPPKPDVACFLFLQSLHSLFGKFIGHGCQVFIN